MHCVEVQANKFNQFKARILALGGEVSVVSRYQERGVRLLDVEVSKDSKAIDRVEQELGYFGL